MQTKYIGDLADFVKFLLLKQLCCTDLSLGINWYLVHNDTSNDGSIKLKESLAGVDRDLFDKLSALKLTKSIKDVETANFFLCKTKYYSEILNYKTRNDWFNKSITDLSKCDIIFCDPDNGLEIPSCKHNNQESIKHVNLNEIKHYFDEGSSVIIYQVGNRNGELDEQEFERKKELSELLGVAMDNIEAIKSCIGIDCFFIVIMQDKHKNELSDRIKMFPQTIFKQNTNL